MSLTTEQISEVVEELEEIVREAREIISGGVSPELQDTRAMAYAYAIEGRARDALQILKRTDIKFRSRDCW